MRSKSGMTEVTPRLAEAEADVQGLVEAHMETMLGGVHPEHGDRCQYLTFTSPGLDRDRLPALFDSCLLTDEEYAAGRDGWKELPHDFDDLLDPVA
jgi:hypothetical protein